MNPGAVHLLTDCPNRSKYRFGRTLGAGTYGIVRQAEGPSGSLVAIKIILKKNVKGNERMVLDELDMLQRMKHPHIVKFFDWFESRVSLRYKTKQSIASREGAVAKPCLAGQILHRHRACDRRRVVRPDLRARQIYGEGRLSDDQAGSRGRGLPAQEQCGTQRHVLPSYTR